MTDDTRTGAAPSDARTEAERAAIEWRQNEGKSGYQRRGNRMADAIDALLAERPAPVIEWGTALIGPDDTIWDQHSHEGGEVSARAAEGPNEDGTEQIVAMWRYAESKWRRADLAERPAPTPDDRAQATKILIAHQRNEAERCLCGWGVLGASHARHQADALIAAGWHR